MARRGGEIPATIPSLLLPPNNMFHLNSEEPSSIILLFKRDSELAQFHCNSVNLGPIATPKY